MEGSAAVIGEMMLPVLEPLSPDAFEPARSLGLAFQLTNFLRDIDEDLDRGRVYVPADDLSGSASISAPPGDPEFKAFLAVSRSSATAPSTRTPTPGSPCCRPASARCVGTARVLYAQILDRIEAADYDVFSGRVRVPTWRKALIAVRIMVLGPPTPSAKPAEIERGKELSVAAHAR